MVKKFYLLLGSLVGIQIGWFIAIGYVLHIIDRKQEVLPIQEYTRLHEIELQLEKDRFLWF